MFTAVSSSYGKLEDVDVDSFKHHLRYFRNENNEELKFFGIFSRFDNFYMNRCDFQRFYSLLPKCIFLQYSIVSLIDYDIVLRFVVFRLQ